MLYNILQKVQFRLQKLHTKTDLIDKSHGYDGNKKQSRPQGCSLLCSKGVLGLEINEVIRGITTIVIIYERFTECNSKS